MDNDTTNRAGDAYKHKNLIEHAQQQVENIGTENQASHLDDTIDKNVEQDNDTSRTDHRHVTHPKIPGYNILNEVGRGGMGIVYRAIQIPLGREVALKVLPANLASIRTDAVDRFRREASAASRLHHHNIIPVFDFGSAHSTFFYSMELIKGQPLNVLIQRLSGENAATLSPVRLAELLSTHTPQAVRNSSESIDNNSPTDTSFTGSGSASSTRGRVYYQQVAKWIADVAEALHYTHSQGIIHRDIKPGNIILSEDGRIMLGDFGLAKVIDDDPVTITGSLLGTVRYVSPEQAMAKRVKVDHRTDVYSLGATLYELLCFQPAFPGTDQAQILGAIIARDPISPRKINRSVPEELETICLKSMEKDPETRYSTAHNFADDLRRYVTDLPIIAKRPSIIQRTIKFVRRHKPATVASVTGLALIIVLSLYIHSSEQARTAQQEKQVAQVASLVFNAELLAGKKRWEDAAALYQQALKVDPRSAKALGNYARLLKDQYNATQNKELLTRAENLINRALLEEPEQSSLLNIKGVICKKLKKYDAAEEAYKKAIRLDPNNPAWHNNVGVIYALRGNLQIAEEEFRSAVSIQVEEASLLCPSWRQLACVQLAHQNDEAIKSIEKANECNPEDAETHIIYALIHLRLEGHFDITEALYHARAADDRPGRLHEKIKRIRAFTFLRNKEYDKAKNYAHEALRLGDLVSVNQLILAIAEYHLGHIDASRMNLSKAREAWPSEQFQSGFLVSGEKGVLWIDIADELTKLLNEAENLILPSESK